MDVPTPLLALLALCPPAMARAQRVHIPSADPPSPRAIAQAEPARVTTWGTVSVLDRDGRWKRDLDGRFELWRMDTGEAGGVVDVERGAWCAELVPGVTYEVSWGGTDDRAWVSQHELTAGGFHALEARVQQEPSLVVFDARTGAELDGVTVILDGSMPPHFWPTKDDIERPWWGVSDAPSPVRLEYDPLRPDWPSRDYWVRATGHAWQRVEVDVSWPGEMLVGLEPAGSIEVGPLDAEASHATIRRLRSGGVIVGCSGSSTIAGLAAGEYLVELRAPDRAGRDLGASFGARRVTVHPGQVARVDFDPRGADPGRPRGGLVVRCELSSDLKPRPGFPRARVLPADPERGPLPEAPFDDFLEEREGSRFTWTWPSLPAGDYVVRILESEPTSHAAVRVQYASAPVEAARVCQVFARSAPERFTLRAFEAPSGDPVGVVAFAMDAESTRRAHLSWSYSLVPKGDAAGSLAYLVPGSRYRVAHAGHLPRWITAPGRSDETIRIELLPAARAHLRLFDRGRPVELEAWGWQAWTTDPSSFLGARHADPAVAVHCNPRHAYAREPYEIVAAAPGRLHVDVTAPAGYLPVPTIEVDVDFGPPREVRVDLERIPSLR